MTERRDCDQSEHVFLQNITLTFSLTPSLCLYSSLLYIFNRDLNYIHYIQCKTNACKVCATAAII